MHCVRKGDVEEGGTTVLQADSALAFSQPRAPSPIVQNLILTDHRATKTPIPASQSARATRTSTHNMERTATCRTSAVPRPQLALGQLQRQPLEPL